MQERDTLEKYRKQIINLIYSHYQIDYNRIESEPATGTSESAAHVFDIYGEELENFFANGILVSIY
jgi:septum formation topological specificity factor MinE